MAFYIGLSSGNEALLTTLPLSSAFSADDGYMSPYNLTLPPGFPAGQTDYFIFYAFDKMFGNPMAARAGGGYYGTSGEFRMTPGSAPVSIATGGGSTWAQVPIMIPDVPIPEPSAFTLTGLGAAAMLIFRRAGSRQFGKRQVSLPLPLR